jgi:hypothetical protein
LRRVPARNLKRAQLDFEDRNGMADGMAERKKLAAGIVLAQVTTLVFARSGRLSSEMTLVSRRNISQGRPA